MKPIKILVIDDQYARDEELKTDLLVKTGMIEAGNAPSISGSIEAKFCSGQKEQDGKLLNNYADIIAKDVAKGWGDNADFNWNLVLLDVRFDSQPIQPEDDSFGVKVREWLRRDFPDLPVVMFTSKHHSEIIDPQEHYLSKEGINERELKRVLLDYGKLEIDQARQLLGIGEDIVFASEQMLKVYRDAYLSAGNDKPILILGESGSGKEGLARCIHNMSLRSKFDYVQFNTAAIPEGLVESILFGTVPGAFPQAKNTKGYFEEADRGTLFLDEIGDMAMPMQAKILRVLQEKKVRRLGGQSDIDVDVRVVSATHCNLEQRILEKTFRDDLFHRIGGSLPITIPPLRERRDDIVPLSQLFLNMEMDARKKLGIQFSETALNKLKRYDFPGNVRELENIVSRLVDRTGNNRVIDEDDIVLPSSNGLVDHLKPQKNADTDLYKNVTSNDNNDTHANPLPAQEGSLEDLLKMMAAIDVRQDDPTLKGIKPRLESAMQALIQRCAGAALERCKNPNSGEYVLQTALQYLTDDASIKGARMYRELDKILDRPQKTGAVDQDDLKALVEIWESSKRQSK